MRYWTAQNTALSVESLGGCITGADIIPFPAAGSPGKAPVKIGLKRFCHQGVLNLGAYLHEGLNAVVLTVEQDDSIVYWDTPHVAHIFFVPVLLGANLFSTFACLAIFVLSAAGTYKALRWLGLEPVLSGIALAGFTYYAIWLHIRPDTLYTADLPDHIRYVLYMMHNWWHPYEYHGGESHQPPIYYMLCGLFIDWLGSFLAASPLALARIFSLLLYMVFVAYGLRTVQENCPTQALCRLGAILLVFWPVAVDMATNINNDFAVYALWAPAFYYLSRGYRERQFSHMRAAIMLTGLAMLIKSTSLVLAGIVAGVIVAGCITRRVQWKRLLERKMLLAYGILLLGALGGIGKLIYTKIAYDQSIGMGNVSYLYFAGVSDHALYPLRYYFTFNVWDFISNPFSVFLQEPGFLNYFLKTALYLQWNHPENIGGIANAINLQLVLILGIMIGGCILLFTRQKGAAEELIPMVLGVVISLAGIIVFTVMHNDEFCQNLRYVYPVLIPVTVLYIRGLEATAKMRFARPVYYAGIALGVSFPLSALCLYLH
jgi:hypothetical protein